PLTNPLRLEGRGRDDQPLLDPSRLEQGMAACHRLDRLSKALVVREEQAPGTEKAANALELVRGEFVLQPLEKPGEIRQHSLVAETTRETRLLVAQEPGEGRRLSMWLGLDEADQIADEVRSVFGRSRERRGEQEGWRARAEPPLDSGL